MFETVWRTKCGAPRRYFYFDYFVQRINSKLMNMSDTGRQIMKTVEHRRRIELEDTAKIVTSVWGAKFVQLLAALTVLPRSN